jgi:ABC-type polysaccharide/polyol phosphate export permease
MKLNPLTYGVTAVRDGLYWGQPRHGGALIVTAAFAVAMFALSLVAARRVTAGDLQ